MTSRRQSRQVSATVRVLIAGGLVIVTIVGAKGSIVSAAPICPEGPRDAPSSETFTPQSARTLRHNAICEEPGVVGQSRNG